MRPASHRSDQPISKTGIVQTTPNQSIFILPSTIQRQWTAFRACFADRCTCDDTRKTSLTSAHSPDTPPAHPFSQSIHLSKNPAKSRQTLHPDWKTSRHRHPQKQEAHAVQSTSAFARDCKSIVGSVAAVVGGALSKHLRPTRQPFFSTALNFFPRSAEALQKA